MIAFGTAFALTLLILSQSVNGRPDAAVDGGRSPEVCRRTRSDDYDTEDEQTAHGLEGRCDRPPLGTRCDVGLRSARREARPVRALGLREAPLSWVNPGYVNRGENYGGWGPRLCGARKVGPTFYNRGYYGVRPYVAPVVPSLGYGGYGGYPAYGGYGAYSGYGYGVAAI